MRIAILTISDAGARGERAADGSGDAIAAWVESRGGTGVTGASDTRSGTGNTGASDTRSGTGVTGASDTRSGTGVTGASDTRSGTGVTGASDTIVGRTIVPDDVPIITAQLIAWCDADAADLVLTTGGTGLAPRDVTPEATRAVLEREAPGIAERMRMMSIESFPRAALSRGIAGVRGRTLVINLPGSTSGVRDGLAALDPIIDHAVRITRGVDLAHDGAGAASS